MRGQIPNPHLKINPSYLYLSFNVAIWLQLR